jgi:hypothetical protein
MARLSSRLNRWSFRSSAALGVLIAGVVLAAVAQSSGGAGHPAGSPLIGVGSAATLPTPQTAPESGNAPSRFSISGGVTGLYPGASLPLVLTIINPQHFSIDVISVTTSVGDASAACPSSNLSVTAFNGNLIVPEQGNATLVLTASLTYFAPDACQGAVFPLTYSGVAAKP